APTGMGIEAIRYVRNPTPPSASFVNGHVNYHTLRLSPALAQIGQDMTVPDYMEANAANTRVVLIHLGGAQNDMAFAWDGLPALEHMNAVLRTAAEFHMHVCIL